MDWSLEEEIDFRESLIESVITEANTGDGMLSRQDLGNFEYAGTQLRLIDPQGGIWNPSESWNLTRPLRGTLSINTTLSGSYDDQEITGGLWRYDYQSGGTEGKNSKLRRTWEFQLPLIWFRQQEPSKRYVPYKVYVVDDFPDQNYCLIAPDLGLSVAYRSGNEIERRYAERVIKQRLHQPAFRARVISAYNTRCAVCNLGLGQLLEGAHITPDSDPNTSTAVTNGISLCKIHHSAYDIGILGIDPDHELHVRQDIMKISDGPMLKYGLQEVDRKTLTLPQSKDQWPDQNRLAQRFSVYLSQET